MDVTKRLAILAAARRLFTRHGLEATNMDRLADVAGVSKATVYKHFQSKEHLFQAVLDDLLAQLPEPGTLVAHGHQQLRPRLLAIGRDFCGLATSPLVQDIREMMADAGVAGGITPGAFWTSCAAPYQAAFAEMLRATAAVDDLEIVDPQLATSQFFALVASEPFLRQATGARPLTGTVLTQHLGAAVDTFLRAFHRPGKATPSA
ncbi:TetR family transcriptional regulator [Lysobacter ruishenii]|uniref:TetR family transcriptional regulator n=2 Tax=Aerolutibacter ruishenii TaxID=686800 RepID=A0A562LVH4_9GAMM|nr:TetR family transcriptional regulator [Lysobacter ruishenii]